MTRTGETTARDAISFFEVGSGRSGTTLLRAMLDAHPLIAVPPENYFLVPLLRQHRVWESAGSVPVDVLVTFLARSPSFTEFGLDPEELRRHWILSPPATIPDAMGDIYWSWARGQGKSFVGDKTPHHVVHVGLLAERFPNSRIVHLIRDGRDVAASLTAAHFGEKRFGLAALKWRRDVLQGISAGRALGAERYHEVFYEELIADPRAVLAELCTFLDIPFDEEMLAYPQRAGSLLAPMAVSSHLDNIRQAPLQTRNWRSSLSGRQIALFDALNRDLLAALPYEPAASTDGLGARVAAYAARGHLAARNQVRRRRKRLGALIGWRPAHRAARRALHVAS